jgi:hypothetical protein
MTDRVMKISFRDGLTVGHLEKALTTAHLQQAVARTNSPPAGATPANSSPSSPPASRPQPVTRQGSQ